MTLGRFYFCLLALLAYLAFAPPSTVERIDQRIYDFMMVVTAPGQPDPRIVVVGIDQKSLDELGRWPWPRDIMGRLVAKMAHYGVAVTALDVSYNTEADKGVATVIDRLGGKMKELGVEKSHPGLFGEYVDIRKTLSKDESLAHDIAAARNVVAGYWFGPLEKAMEKPDAAQLAKRALLDPFVLGDDFRDEMSAGATILGQYGDVEPNIPIVQKSLASSGFLNAFPSQTDGVIRSHPMVKEKEGKVYPSFALAIAAQYMSGQSDFVEGLADLVPLYESGLFQGVDLGDYFLQTDAGGHVYLRYYGPDETFPLLSVVDILNADPEDAAMRARLEGKIAVVGATALGIYDLRVTPFGFTAGVEIQATAVANALSNLTIQKLEWQQGLDMALTIVIGVALFFILQRASVAGGLIFTLLLLGSMFYFNFWMFAEKGIWLNSVIPAATIAIGFTTVTVWEYIREQRSKRFIHDAFGRYLSPKVISQIITNPGQLRLGGEKRVMTAFFSDVAGFTSISEKMTPPQLVKLLNKYLSEMSYIIHETDGTVDKYEGDAIIAFWGAPLPQEDHPVQCVRAAVRQQRRLSELRQEWRKQGKDELQARMGINTGPMVVGNMGSKERMDYTIMGDSVNLAARLEGANKYYGSYILVSEFTYNEIRQSFLCRNLDTVRVQGKKEPIRLYEVIEEISLSTEAQRRQALFFEQALSAFHRLDFHKASRLFERCDKIRPGGDTACKLYLKRCSELIESPPPEDWDRVYDLAK